MSKITLTRLDMRTGNSISRSFAEAMEPREETKGSEVDMIEPREAVQAVAWLDTMYEESGLTPTRANEAATTIQVSKSGHSSYYCIICEITMYRVFCQEFVHRKLKRNYLQLSRMSCRKLTDGTARKKATLNRR